MQERSEIPARRHRQRLKVLLWTAIALWIILPAGISNPTKNANGVTAQLPATLRQLAQIDSVSIPEALKAFKQGVDNYLNERYEAALDSFPDETAAKTTSVPDYVLFYRAKSHLMMDRDKEALDHFRALENRYPDSSLIQDALLGQCQALLKLHDPKSALSILKNPKIDKDSETMYYEARALELAGEKEKALERYLSLYAGYPKSNFSTLAEHNLLSLSPGALKGKRNYAARLQRSESLLNANDAKGARSLLLALGRVAASDSASSQKRNLLMGDVEYRLGKTTTALSLLRKVTAENSALHARALRLEGSCLRRLKREQALLEQREKALRLYPNSPETEELCYSVATYFDVEGESAKAWEAYKVLFERFPKGRYAERTLWKLALFHYFGREYAEAAQKFWRYLLAYPNPAPAGSAMYWMGRCYEKLSGPQNAIYLYGRVQELANNSYFGQCARQARASLQNSGGTEKISIPGIDFEKVIAACDGIRLPMTAFAEPSRAAVPAIERARQLWAAGLTDLAIFELQWASRRYPKDDMTISYVASRIYESKENHLRAIAGLRRLFPDYANRPLESLPNEIWQLLYPVRYWNVLSARAAKTQLDPSLILGLIRQESSFNEQARSSANARGLMQILTSTGPKLARQAGITRYSAKKLYQPETNITLGTHYLSSLLRSYGKLELALAAYNAGASRVDRWLKEYGNADMPEFVERIPFGETRGYIKQVLSNQALYRLLISSGTPENP